MPCDVHFIDKCPICKNHIKPQPVPNTVDSAIPAAQPVVHIPTVVPDVTDPQAKNALELSQALEEVATMKGTVVGLRGTLKLAEESLASAEKKVQEKLAALQQAIAPRQNERAMPASSEKAG